MSTLIIKVSTKQVNKDKMEALKEAGCFADVQVCVFETLGGGGLFVFRQGCV